MMRFKVTPDPAAGEPYVVDAGSRDVLVWEKAAKGRSFAVLLTEPNLQDYYRVAHIAARRLGLFDGSLADFETSVDIDTDDTEDVPDPT